MCREQKAQFRAKLHLGRGPRRITQAMQRIGEVMLHMMGADGRLDPSMNTLAARAAVTRQTVVAAIERLERFGFLTRTRRLVRCGSRVEQTSNSYVLRVPGPESSFPTRVPISDSSKRVQGGMMSLKAQRQTAIQQFLTLGWPVPPEWLT